MSTPTRPNLVLLFADQQHFEALGHVDPFFDTPNLDALATQATCFTQTLCATPQCSPSRASMFTGLYPHRTGVQGNVNNAGGDPLNQPTIGKALSDAGYHTGYFGKWHLGELPVSQAGWQAMRIGTQDPAMATHAIRFVHEAVQRDDPFALVLSLNNPHDVYHFHPLETARASDDADQAASVLPRSWHEETFARKPAVQRRFMTDDQGKLMEGQPAHVWAAYRQRYREMVRRYDREAGRLINALKNSGAWDNTVLIVTSDHGDMDAHHRLIFKGPFMYEHLVRVPMMIRVPEALGGFVGMVHEPVTLLDLAPTLLDFAGLTPPAACDGFSLKPALTGKGPLAQRPFIVSQYFGKQQWVNPMRMIRTATMKYIEAANGDAELYDLQQDPDELHNLAHAPAPASTHEKVRDQWRSQLQQWIDEHDDPFYSQQPTTRNGEPIVT